MNAMKVQQELIKDQGGAENMSTARLVLVELIARDVFYLDETDRRIFRTLKEYPKVKNKPAALAKLYSYRSNVVANLTRSLAMLGLDKVPPKAKTLEEIFANDSVNTNGGDHEETKTRTEERTEENSQETEKTDPAE